MQTCFSGHRLESLVVFVFMSLRPLFWSIFQPLLAQGSISGLCFHVWQHFLLHGVVCNAIWSAFGLVLMFTVPKQALLASGTFGDTANFDLMLRTSHKPPSKLGVHLIPPELHLKLLSKSSFQLSNLTLPSEHLLHSVAHN